MPETIQPTSEKTAPKLLLVDGHYYLYRAFFSVRELKNSKGEPTNAIFAFAKAIRKMLAEVAPTHAAVLWDSGLPEKRVSLLPSYKQQRTPMPDDLKTQEKPVMELCPLLGIKSLRSSRIEADDLIAAYTKAALPESEVVIATSDKDIFQLVTDRARIYSPNKPAPVPGTGTSFSLLGPAEVEEKWGVPASSIRDVLSLTGDTADNIPGVPGIGPKTAAALVREFGSIENLLANSARIAKDGTRKKIQDSADLIRTNYQLVGLFDDVPLPAPISELTLCPDYPNLIRFFRECEFRSLLLEVEKEASPFLPPTPQPAPDPSPKLEQGYLF